jgi:hypothetical protein
MVPERGAWVDIHFVNCGSLWLLSDRLSWCLMRAFQQRGRANVLDHECLYTTLSYSFLKEHNAVLFDQVNHSVLNIV